MRSKVTVQPVDHVDGVSGSPAELLRSKGNSPFRVRAGHSREIYLYLWIARKNRASGQP